MDLDAKAKRAIRTHHWMKTGDHIAIALSGDPATIALVFFLTKLTEKRRDIRISAITIDEGIEGFRNPVQVKTVAESLGVSLTCGSFGEEYGITVDEIARQKGATHAYRYCRILRHHLLNRIACGIGATKLALGTSLDDGALDVLSDVLCGNTEYLFVTQRTSPGIVLQIHPFMDLPAQELRLYAAIHSDMIPNGEDLPARCPYASTAIEQDIRAMLEDYTQNHPATKHALVNLRENLCLTPCTATDCLPNCPRCGEPGAGTTCRNCEVLDEFGRGLT
jgi:uncharacterized protein (TIGR00269 family)